MCDWGARSWIRDCGSWRGVDRGQRKLRCSIFRLLGRDSELVDSKDGVDLSSDPRSIARSLVVASPPSPEANPTCFAQNRSVLPTARWIVTGPSSRPFRIPRRLHRSAAVAFLGERLPSRRTELGGSGRGFGVVVVVLSRVGVVRWRHRATPVVAAPSLRPCEAAFQRDKGLPPPWCMLCASCRFPASPARCRIWRRFESSRTRRATDQREQRRKRRSTIEGGKVTPRGKGDRTSSCPSRRRLFPSFDESARNGARRIKVPPYRYCRADWMTKIREPVHTCRQSNEVTTYYVRVEIYCICLPMPIRKHSSRTISLALNLSAPPSPGTVSPCLMAIRDRNADARVSIQRS